MPPNPMWLRAWPEGPRHPSCLQAPCLITCQPPAQPSGPCAARAGQRPAHVLPGMAPELRRHHSEPWSVPGTFCFDLSDIVIIAVAAAVLVAWRLSVVYLLCSFFSQLVSFSPPLQIEVVNTFKSGASFQGALRRQSSVTSQSQDVANLSSPSRVSLSNALSSPTSLPPAAAGRECDPLLPRAPATPVLGGQGPGRQGHGWWGSSRHGQAQWAEGPQPLRRVPVGQETTASHRVTVTQWARVGWGQGLGFSCSARGS